jgi:putative flippase GtrA
MWREFLKFANSGAVGTIVHYCLLWGLVDLLNVNPVAGSAVGALAGSLVNYLLNYHWTFNSQLPHSHTLPRFMAIALFSLILNTLLMVILMSLSKLHYLVAQLFVTAICLMVNYFASRFWAFGGKLQ